MYLERFVERRPSPLAPRHQLRTSGDAHYLVYRCLMSTVAVGLRTSEHVEIEIHGLERPSEPVSDDERWLTCRVSVRAGGFSGSFSAACVAADFSHFLTGVRNLNQTLVGEAELNTVEGQLHLVIRRVGSLGEMQASGTAVDVPGSGNRLAFTLRDFDQTQLPALIRELEAVTGT
jgi:hypothetical protein